MIGDEALNDEIRRLVEEGWALASQTDATAGMSRDELVIFLELQNDGSVRISGTDKDLAIDETPVNIPSPIKATDPLEESIEVSNQL